MISIYAQVYWPNSRVSNKMTASRQGFDRGMRSLWYCSWTGERVQSLGPNRRARSLVDTMGASGMDLRIRESVV